MCCKILSSGKLYIKLKCVHIVYLVLVWINILSISRSLSFCITELHEG